MLEDDAVRVLEPSEGCKWVVTVKKKQTQRRTRFGGFQRRLVMTYIEYDSRVILRMALLMLFDLSIHEKPKYALEVDGSRMCIDRFLFV